MRLLRIRNIEIDLFRDEFSLRPSMHSGVETSEFWQRYFGFRWLRLISVSDSR